MSLLTLHLHPPVLDAHERRSPRASSSGLALYVLVKQDHRWWITTRQDTLVPSPGPS